jgi:hypothetical protein
MAKENITFDSRENVKTYLADDKDMKKCARI